MRTLHTLSLIHILKSAKNVEAAVELALQELGLTRDKVSVEVVDEGARGLFLSLIHI